MDPTLLKKPVRWAFISLLTAGLLFPILSCNKEDVDAPSRKENNSGALNIYLTDAPGNYQAVLIDIQAIEIIKTDGVAQLVKLIHPGVYDLLRLRNGIDTLIGVVHVAVDSVSQIRLILGNNNYLKVDGMLYALATPSALQSGLKLNVHSDLLGGNLSDIWIDFDVARSIVKRADGGYNLIPVLRSYIKALTGAIKGAVAHYGGPAAVFVIQQADTICTALSDSSGKFKVSGLKPGTYQLLFKANVAVANIQVSGVPVKAGSDTDVGLVVVL